MITESQRKYHTYLAKISNLKVLVWGLGISGGGVNVAKYFSMHGAQVRIIDSKTDEELSESVKQLKSFKNIDLALGSQKQEDFLWADLIIKNPAIPPSSEWNQFIADHHLNVDMELNIFLKYFPGKIVGVTGTRGKSTTTELIYLMLKAAGKNVFTGGNNKLPLLLHLDEASDDQIAVIEMSSFQLSSVNNSPHIAVVTNLYPDHLNWHPDMQDYISAKQNIVRFQSSSDKKILNTDNTIVKDNFSHEGNSILIPIGSGGQFEIKNNTIFHRSKEYISEFQLKIRGEHNLQNLSLAIAAAKELGVPDEVIVKVATTFETLQFRQQIVKQKDGYIVVNDSCATTPEGQMAALERFKRESKRIYLIAGGVNKNLDLSKLSQRISDLVEEVYFLEGTFYETLKGMLKDKPKINGPYSDLSSIIKDVSKKLSAGDCLLFSPGAASFNLFQNEWDRGDKFNQAIKSL